MYHNEQLFAYHVRELAMKRLVHETHEGPTAEAATQHMFERFEPTVIGMVRELQNVATMIRKAAPARQARTGRRSRVPGTATAREAARAAIR